MASTVFGPERHLSHTQINRYLIAGALLCALLCMLPMLFTANTLWIGLCLSSPGGFFEVIIGPI